jgi:predicted RND superfamily exporter protein
MLGFIALAGIVVNHSIILVDVWNRLRKEHPDMSLRDVVIEGAVIRIRPILLTKVTTIIGVAPLMFASDMWRPIAIAITFGLIFAGVLTLLLVPALYLKFCKYTKKSSERIEEEDTEVEGKMEHITEVLKKKQFQFSTIIRGLFIFVPFLLVSLVPITTNAFMYTQDTIQSVYHEAPATFHVDAYGNTEGATVSGMVFRQYTVASEYGVRLQRFEIGNAHWYVSDKGVIWEDTDLGALSVYLSRLG